MRLSLLLCMIFLACAGLAVAQQPLKVIKSYSRTGENINAARVIIVEQGNYIDNTAGHLQNITEKILDAVTRLVENSKTEKKQMAELIQRTKEILQREKNISSALTEIKTGINTLPADTATEKVSSKNELLELFGETEWLSDIAAVDKMGDTFYANTANVINDQTVLFRSDFLNTDIIAVKKHNAYGYSDSTGKMVMDYLFDEATAFENGIAVVKKNGNWFFINKEGRVLKNLGEANKIYPLFGGYSLAIVPDNNREKTPVLRIIDTSGKHSYLIALNNNIKAETLVDCKLGRIIIRKGENQFAVCNYKGEELYVLVYNKVSPASKKGIVTLHNNGLYGYYDIVNNRMISDLRYTEAEEFNYSSAIVRNSNQEYGLINQNNYTLIEFGKYKVSRILNSDFLSFSRIAVKKKSRSSFITSGDLKCISGDCDIK